jgi:hypothetical protein
MDRIDQREPNFRAASIFLLGLVFTLSGCSDGNDGTVQNSSPEFNIEVSAVDDSNAAVQLKFISWGYVDIDGNVANWTEVLCDTPESLIQCDILNIGFEAHGEIRVFGSSGLERSGISTCISWIEGAEDVLANPTQEQRLTLRLDEYGGGCAD